MKDVEINEKDLAKRLRENRKLHKEYENLKHEDDILDDSSSSSSSHLNMFGMGGGAYPSIENMFGSGVGEPPNNMDKMINEMFNRVMDKSMGPQKLRLRGIIGKSNIDIEINDKASAEMALIAINNKIKEFTNDGGSGGR